MLLQQKVQQSNKCNKMNVFLITYYISSTVQKELGDNFISLIKPVESSDGVVLSTNSATS